MFFFFKRKTAYELRISDWSSDVCSSELFCVGDEIVARRPARRLHPPDSPREYVRNGSRGRIVGFRAEEPTGPRLVVAFERSEECRVGTECVSTCRSRWSQYHSKKKKYRYVTRDQSTS